MTETLQRPVWARTARILLALLAAQPLAYVTALTWARFVHLLLVTAGMGYLIWRSAAPHRGKQAAQTQMLPVVVALALFFILYQFRAGALTAPVPALVVWPQWLPAVLVTGSFLAMSMAAPRSLRWSAWPGCRADATVVGIAFVAAVAAVAFRPGTPPVEGDGGSFPWSTLGYVLLTVLLWFAATRALSLQPAAGRRLALWVWAVLALTAMLGVGQAAATLSYIRRGDAARTQNELSRATRLYQRGHHLASRLQMAGATDISAFGLAAVLAVQGRDEEAAAALGLEPGYVQRIDADAWEGPEGGNLYYEVSCWKDLVLYPGEIEIRIFARGDRAKGVWPLMRVELGGVRLDDVFVSSAETQPYSFFIEVPETRRARLELEFMNDFHQTNPYMDRNLWIQHAEIHYLKIAWE